MSQFWMPTITQRIRTHQSMLAYYRGQIVDLQVEACQSLDVNEVRMLAGTIECYRELADEEIERHEEFMSGGSI